jgi:glycosyltransferase involved in cell wall biosynthesis
VKILLVTHRYPPLGVSGVERLSEQTAVELSRVGNEVTVLTRHDLATPSIPCLRRSEPRGVHVLTILGGGPLHGQFPKLAPILDRLFERTLLDVDPDVVLIKHLINHSPNYVSIAQKWDVPVVMELHDFFTVCDRAHLQRVSGERCEGPEGGSACATHCFPKTRRAHERWAVRTHMFRHALQAADGLICPSRFVADYFATAFGGQLPPLHVIGNGIDVTPSASAGTDRALDRGGRLRLACVGVVAEHKGIHVLLEALRLARLPDVSLNLIGEIYPPYFRELRRTARKIENLELRAYGRFEPVELPLLLEDVDLVVIPSVVWETYSLVAREAMACGVPVLAARLGALPEAVRHGENGLLFDPESAVDLAATLQTLASDPGRLEELRGGIKASDWISVRERTASLLAVLRAVTASRTYAPAADSGNEELLILRDALLAN